MAHTNSAAISHAQDYGTPTVGPSCTTITPVSTCTDIDDAYDIMTTACVGKNNCTVGTEVNGTPVEVCCGTPADYNESAALPQLASTVYY